MARKRLRIVDIVAGDFLTTYAENGIATKATTGDTVFAIAVTDYTVDDSNGIIEAFVIPPRRL